MYDFKKYIKYMYGKHPLETRFFISYLRKRAILGRFKKNTDKFSYQDEHWHPPVPISLMGWAFDYKQSDEGSDFWEDEINMWSIEYDKFHHAFKEYGLFPK